MYLVNLNFDTEYHIFFQTNAEFNNERTLCMIDRNEKEIYSRYQEKFSEIIGCLHEQSMTKGI